MIRGFACIVKLNSRKRVFTMPDTENMRTEASPSEAMSKFQDKTHWFKRWQEGQIGFHRAEGHPWLPQFRTKLKARHVLLPLCGKSQDLLYLSRQGKQVLGVELVPQAVEAFFQENSLNAEPFQYGDFNAYRSGNIVIYQGDFFTFKAPQSCDIFDRAALIALSAELRPHYARNILKLLHHNMLLVTQEYMEGAQPARANPPYRVCASEVHRLYGRDCQIELLASQEIMSGGSPARERLYWLEKQS